MQRTRLTEIASWLERLHDFRRFEQISAPRFLKPFHFITLALVVRQTGMREIHLPEALANYAVRMGLWEAAGIPPPYVAHCSRPTRRFMPVTALVDAMLVQNTATELTTIIAPGSDDISTVLIELLNNCYDHSEMTAGLWGLACAQTWPRGNLAQIAIADCGIGIRASLLQNPEIRPILNTKNACVYAAEYGVTGKPKHHTGYGLTLARDLLQPNGGQLIVSSGAEIACFRDGQSMIHNDDQPWDGTLIVFEWRLNRPLDTLAVYQQWPLPEGMTPDDFDWP